MDRTYLVRFIADSAAGFFVKDIRLTREPLGSNPVSELPVDHAVVAGFSPRASATVCKEFVTTAHQRLHVTAVWECMSFSQQRFAVNRSQDGASLRATASQKSFHFGSSSSQTVTACLSQDVLEELHHGRRSSVWICGRALKGKLEHVTDPPAIEEMRHLE